MSGQLHALEKFPFLSERQFVNLSYFCVLSIGLFVLFVTNSFKACSMEWCIERTLQYVSSLLQLSCECTLVTVYHYRTYFYVRGLIEKF